MTEEQINATAPTANNGHTGDTILATLGKTFFNANPAITGITTTCATEATIAMESTSMIPVGAPFVLDAATNNGAINLLVRNGVANAAKHVLNVVNATDKETFAFAKNATTFEAAPPGQHPTKINPSLALFSNPNIWPTKNPSNGIMVNCNKDPRNTRADPFTESICLNDPSSNVTPMPSMAIPNAGVTISDFESGATTVGLKSPTRAPKTIHSGNKFARVFKLDSIEYRKFIAFVFKSPLLFLLLLLYSFFNPLEEEDTEEEEDENAVVFAFRAFMAKGGFGCTPIITNARVVFTLLLETQSELFPTTKDPFLGPLGDHPNLSPPHKKPSPKLFFEDEEEDLEESTQFKHCCCVCTVAAEIIVIIASSKSLLRVVLLWTLCSFFPFEQKHKKRKDESQKQSIGLDTLN
jgi:hypothetical protein